MGRQDIDSAAKDAMKARPKDLLQVLFGDGVRRVRVLPPELVTRTTLPDGVFELELDGKRTVARVEVELEPRARTRARVRRWWHQLAWAVRAQVRIAVVYLKPRGRRPVPRTFTVEDPAGQKHELSFEPLCMWELDPVRVLRDGPPGLLPYVPWMRGATERHIEQALRRVGTARGVASRTRADLRVLTLVFANRVLPEGEWLGKLRRVDRQMSDFMQQLVELERPRLEAEARKKGRAEGRARGLAEGRAEGRAEAEARARAEARKLLLEVIRARLGRVPREAGTFVRNLGDARRLRALHLKVAAAETKDDVLAALRLRAKAR